MSRIDICLERETANDEFAVVVKIHASTGDRVAAHQHIFDIENSKATQEVVAPAEGILLHALNVGDEISFGVPIATIASTDEASLTPPLVTRIPSSPASPSLPSELLVLPTDRIEARQPDSEGYPSRPTERQPKFSKAANELLSSAHIDPASFPMEFVTAAEVRKRLAGNFSLESSATNTNAQRTGTPARLSMHKRAETQSLSAGAGASMLSVLGTNLGRIAPSRKSGGIFDDRISDFVIYESSRLMMKYSKLNSYFLDGAVHLHASIVAGFAMDEGSRLVVYGIQNPHLLGLAEIQTEVTSAVSKYVERTLTVDEMSRATYTISDLSAQSLDFMFPLLPERQSCIIGITRAIDGAFRLYVGFDHRVTEGREVALFLEELRSRIVSFGETNVSNAKCFFCEKSLLTEIEKFRNKGLVKIMNGFGNEVHCCLSCLNGW